jgi:hypothetical protein
MGRQNAIPGGFVWGRACTCRTHTPLQPCVHVARPCGVLARQLDKCVQAQVTTGHWPRQGRLALLRHTQSFLWDVRFVAGAEPLNLQRDTLGFEVSPVCGICFDGSQEILALMTETEARGICDVSL